MLISSWCFLIFCLNIVHFSKQDVVQPTNQDLLNAILKMDSRLDQLDVTLENIKDDFTNIRGRLSSMEGEIEDIGGRTSVTLVASRNTLNASRETLNELNMLKLNISNDGKLLHKQTLNEFNMMKHNLSEDGKLLQNQTVSEINVMKNNISGELLSLNVKVTIFEENLSEKLNETSELIHNMTRDPIDAIKNTVLSLEENVNVIKMFNTNNSELLEAIKLEAESMKDPLNIMRTTLLSLENNVDQIQKSQSNTSVSLQNIEGDTEYMKAPIDKFSTIEDIVKDIQKKQVMDIKELLQDMKTPINKFSTIEDIVKDIQKIQVTDIKELLQDMKTPINKFSTFEDIVKDIQKIQVTDIKELLQDINDKTGSLEAPIKNIGSIATTVTQIKKTLEKRCPVADGFFSTPGGNQCMKEYRDQKRSWSDAKSFCLAQGLILAKPVDAVFIQKYLIEKHGDSVYWVSARGSAGEYKWMQDNTVLHSSSTLWVPGNPNYGGSSSYCVLLSTYTSHTGTPYYDYTCSNKQYYPLCERIMG